MNWNHVEIAGYVAAGIVYLIGFFTSLSDMLDNGPSLKEYRAKYGHDLGLIVCGFTRGFVTVGWPAFGGVKFAVGAIRDSIKLVLVGKGNKSV